AIGVVSTIVVEKHIKSDLVAVDYRADAPRRHAVLDALRPLCGTTRHMLFCESVRFRHDSGHLFALGALL
ncbi:hypothetical protein, partial [Pseudomonas cannabina]|uniref:hypothetical protein n=1 Tax=Pseudomonas cannabina TaxID=86840 RepID=UPI001C808A7F